MKRSLFLLLFAGSCVAAGMATWIYMAWKTAMDLDSITPESDTGGSLMGWAVSGTLLMITGMILLHFAADDAEESRKDEDG